MESNAHLESDSFEVSAIAHMDSVYRSALYMTRNEADAQDLVQDTYMRAYKFFHKFEAGTDCKAWLMTILRHTFVNNIRRNKKRRHDVSLSKLESYGLELPAQGGPEDEIFGDLLDDDISEAMSKLPPVYRNVVELADLKGFSYKEIAHVLDCPMGTVMSRLFRGRRLLKQTLESYAVQSGYVQAELTMA